MTEQNLNTEPNNSTKPVLSAVLYPELKDMENAILTLENGFLFSSLTSMLTKDEEKELCLLLYKWKINFINHKKEVINGMLSELSEK
jgi:hypothetical protein